MRTVGAVLFDKTGTLTKGEPAVTAVIATAGSTDDDVLALAAAAGPARDALAAEDRRGRPRSSALPSATREAAQLSLEVMCGLRLDVKWSLL